MHVLSGLRTQTRSWVTGHHSGACVENSAQARNCLRRRGARLSRCTDLPEFPACRAGVLLRLPDCPRAMECLRYLPRLLPRAAQSRSALCMAAVRLSLAACCGRATPLTSGSQKAPSTPRTAGTRVPRGPAASAPPALGPAVLTAAWPRQAHPALSSQASTMRT